jgi:hypothetical protein
MDQIPIELTQRVVEWLDPASVKRFGNTTHAHHTHMSEYANSADYAQMLMRLARLYLIQTVSDRYAPSDGSQIRAEAMRGPPPGLAGDLQKFDRTERRQLLRAGVRRRIRPQPGPIDGVRAFVDGVIAALGGDDVTLGSAPHYACLRVLYPVAFQAGSEWPWGAFAIEWCARHERLILEGKNEPRGELLALLHADASERLYNMRGAWSEGNRFHASIVRTACQQSSRETSREVQRLGRGMIANAHTPDELAIGVALTAVILERARRSDRGTCDTPLSMLPRAFTGFAPLLMSRRPPSSWLDLVGMHPITRRPPSGWLDLVGMHPDSSRRIAPMLNAFVYQGGAELTARAGPPPIRARISSEPRSGSDSEAEEVE